MEAALTGTNCHPATAWALMARGMSLYAVATRYGDDLGRLDQAVWGYRAARTYRNIETRNHV